MFEHIMCLTGAEMTMLILFVVILATGIVNILYDEKIKGIIKTVISAVLIVITIGYVYIPGLKVSNQADHQDLQNKYKVYEMAIHNDSNAQNYMYDNIKKYNYDIDGYKMLANSRVFKWSYKGAEPDDLKDIEIQ